MESDMTCFTQWWKEKKSSSNVAQSTMGLNGEILIIILSDN